MCSILERDRRGLVVHLRRSKTDQAGKGQTIAVLYSKLKVPAAVDAWFESSGITEGPVFRGCDRGRLKAGWAVPVTRGRISVASK
ncbi:hypothetical protein SAMN04488125_1288 [Methylorubrum salsuginis]|uniref:Uncharacterized protein n=2 Tax=Methylorubrum salsuginis TaxID=414703 RepID=A0A1I4L771_9HYPH|nr:hypothetical protein SAMN04488125_1288 [Methylorubrum salsuginis]